MYRKSIIRPSGVEYTDYNANIYAGCFHGCRYCYARLITKRDKELLEKICRARGEDPSGIVRRAIRKEFAALSYLPEEEKKALGIKE